MKHSPDIFNLKQVAMSDSNIMDKPPRYENNNPMYSPRRAYNPEKYHPESEERFSKP